MAEMITTCNISLPLDVVKSSPSKPRSRPESKVGIVPPGAVIDGDKAKAALGRLWSRVFDKENPALVPVHGGPEDPVAPDANPPRTVVHQVSGGRDEVATTEGRKIDTDASDDGEPAKPTRRAKTRRSK